MPSEQNFTLNRSIQTLFGVGAIGGMTDEQLLERFATRRDGGAEAAFTALVERHGPMVLGVCRQILRDEHDAEDAFQATFLILAGKARSIRKRDLLENWLYKVAYRVALQAKTASVRRRAAERESVDAMARSSPDAVPADLLAVLHEEVNRLPDKYRAPVVLCYLKGQTNDAAARQLGWPVGTVSGRLARARERLRLRLSRRGLALPSGLLVAALSPRAGSAAVPTGLMTATVRAAMGVAGKATAAGAISASVTSLMNEVLRTMLMTKLKIAGMSLLAAGVLASGVEGLARQLPGNSPSGAARATVEFPREPSATQPGLPSRTDETLIGPANSRRKGSKTEGHESRESEGQKVKKRHDEGQEVKEREGEREGERQEVKTREDESQRPKNREGEREREGHKAKTRERENREGERGREGHKEKEREDGREREGPERR
jgi:RNA polymerase sigma factor (sigma-70 family)